MGVEAGNRRGGSGMKDELTEYGRNMIATRMVEMSRYAVRQGRLVFAYEDDAVSFVNFAPFNPKSVELFRKNMKKDMPWGFFIGGKGCPQELQEQDRENAVKALGQSFPADVLRAAVEIAEKYNASTAIEVSANGEVKHG